MGGRTTAGLLSCVIWLTGCVSVTDKPDDMCAAIAAFANASGEGPVHSVGLTTDWGGTFSPKDDPDSIVAAEKDCRHDKYAAGKALCAYLVEHTSTEFATANYRRALACIGYHVEGASPIDDHGLPASAESRTVRGVKRGIQVRVGLRPGTDSAPPTMVITPGRFSR